MVQQIDFTLNQVLKAENIETLKSYGAYVELKNRIEQYIGFSLGVKNWNDLFEKMLLLREAVTTENEIIRKIINESSFIAAKSQLSHTLGICIQAKSKQQLATKIDNLLKVFSWSCFDPYKKFEETKFRNFQNSSRLEGIMIEGPAGSMNLNDVIAKYKRYCNG
ncbi:hypothetical protein KKJ17_06650 [Xenorhabdus bovienii]|uniref:hypothetical protein n=1 Tax=Xenorhabdus bovienii TaxID=40576 RepID=UPI00237CCCB2|nr:hypothetical protein [Xenorhabdus bovienii]MDE1488716.1 hypothetical protein [Xenorhabdus bovienii]MDE1494338.1 hypothetical protein [Xenorhabdus bovienii]MDE9473750.1 hypothetical protein [Xenorhabdus bovienii]MDE9479567.1 hypothetical protein [Xenorhabdus bovienii]MDE9492528.1 hypothetical protein [Xenorhabdus bovienii]